jgi:hypothetical protein
MTVPKGICERKEKRNPGWTKEQNDNDENNKTSNELKEWEG